ncbi:MAG: N-acetyl-gamma-glutamyl-phosphate reductase [Candidatus Omnitrophica bacterium]|nr:N-acetyl-gamma-glutamyl-phosphate reductase [Candidatus Omnitrophota bacterium]
MIRCAVVGATGFTGIELIKILVRHPGVTLTALTTRQDKAILVNDLIPVLARKSSLAIRSYTMKELLQSADLFFICLPHTEAAETAAKLYRAGKTVIDLSADARLKRAADYPIWYGYKHPVPDILRKSVYGLPEIYRKKIRNANLIANPGCYPTGAALALWPLVKQRLIQLDSIIVDAKSGVSGAGKKLSASTHFCEVAGNFKAYKVNQHQHTPEIEQTLSEQAGQKIKVTFVPHLLPIERGILSTVYVRRSKGIKPAVIAKAFQAAYDGEAFVRFRGEGVFPSIKDVAGTNFCDIGVAVDPASDRIIVISAIDNLLKGASGQAVQNMNIRFDFPEDQGLL